MIFYVFFFIMTVLVIGEYTGHLYGAIGFLLIIVILFLVLFYYIYYVGEKDLKLRKKLFNDFYLSLSFEEVRLCDSFYQRFYGANFGDRKYEKFCKIDYNNKAKVDEFFRQLRNNVECVCRLEREEINDRKMREEQRERQKRKEEYQNSNQYQEYHEKRKNTFEEKFNNILNDYSKHLKILQVDENYTKSDIRKSYLRLANIYHPDKGNEKSSEKFIELKKSYDFLMSKF